MGNVKFGRKGLMEFIVRDFAERYLDLKGSFDLDEIRDVPIEKFPTDFVDESYSIWDVKYCMHCLGLIDRRLDSWFKQSNGHDGSKILFHISISDNICEDYGIIDILFDVSSNGGVSFKRCKRCGKLFIADDKIDYCHYTDKDNPVSCYQMYLNENAKNDIKYLIESFAYNSEKLNSYSNIATEKYERWVSKATSKLQEFVFLTNEDYTEANIENMHNIISWMHHSADELISEETK